MSDYFKPIKKDVEATLTKHGDFYAVTTHPRSMPLIKRIDNYVKERERERESNGSTHEVELLNGTTDNIIANLDANYHKGLGPADVRKNRRRRTHVIEKPVKITTNTSKGYDEAYPNDGIRLAHPSSTTARGRTGSESTEALSCTEGCDWGTLTPEYRIRRLTPRECERLQAFPDDWTKYGKDDELISDTQRYKCIGNAVTTTVITYIINEMFDEVFKDG